MGHQFSSTNMIRVRNRRLPPSFSISQSLFERGEPATRLNEHFRRTRRQASAPSNTRYIQEWLEAGGLLDFGDEIRRTFRGTCHDFLGHNHAYKPCQVVATWRIKLLCYVTCHAKLLYCCLVWNGRQTPAVLACDRDLEATRVGRAVEGRKGSPRPVYWYNVCGGSADSLLAVEASSH